MANLNGVLAYQHIYCGSNEPPKLVSWTVTQDMGQDAAMSKAQ